jgi:hypothetical protein
MMRPLKPGRESNNASLLAKQAHFRKNVRSFLFASISRKSGTLIHEFTLPESRNGEVILNFHSKQ